MIVEDLRHARMVFTSLLHNAEKSIGHKYFAFDTETEGTPPYPNKDALIHGRPRIVVFSACVNGESYCFPTRNFDKGFPTEEEYGDLLRPIFQDRSVVKVMHNSNYDLNVVYHRFDIRVVHRIWDTLIAAWKAAEYKEKGLKQRAPMFGRFLRETKTVNFLNLDELAEYAEQDVVATDELYQAQIKGRIIRPKVIKFTDASGNYRSVANPFYDPTTHGKVSFPKDEKLTDFDKQWLYTLEYPVLRSTMRAERAGFPIDIPRLYQLRKKLSNDLRKSLKKMYEIAGELFNPSSGKDLSRICEDLDINNPFSTKKGAASFDAAALVRLQGVHPFLDQLARYRKLEKMSTTYIGTKAYDVEHKGKNVSGLEYYINPATGSIHCTMNTVAAVTGRFSAQKPNLQQIPARRDEYGVKTCFVAVPNSFDVYSPKYSNPRTLLVLDYSQLELRVMALYSKDDAMTKLLSDPKGDIHSHTAKTFGVDRQSAKNLNFLLLYGGGFYMLAQTLTTFGVPTDEGQAKAYTTRHSEVYPGVPEFRLRLVAEHQENGRVQMFTGRYRTLPDIDWESKFSVHKAETTLSNNVVQGAGQDFLKASIVRSDPACINPDEVMLNQSRVKLPKKHVLYLKDKKRELIKYRKILKAADCRFRLQVHDEAIFTVQPSAAKECLDIIAEIMSWRHYFPSTSDYNVPVVAEGGIGHTWKEAKSDDSPYKVKSGYKDWERYA